VNLTQNPSAGIKEIEMLKKVLFAVAPLCLIAVGSFANASDDLFSEVASLNADSISSADVAIEDISLDLDVDALAADTENGEDAIEACFRNFYGSYYGGYHGCYNYYRPCYSYYYCYRPVYTYCYTPVYYHYWGCY
jgi:hypothetical protein